MKVELTTLAKMGRFDQEVSIDMPAASDIPRRSEKCTVDDHRQARVHGLRGLLRGLVAGDAARVFGVAHPRPMERRGGEPSLFDIEVKADGQTGEKVGHLCIVLPDDDGRSSRSR